MIKSAFVRYFSDYFTIILERNNDEDDIVQCPVVISTLSSAATTTRLAAHQELHRRSAYASDLLALVLHYSPPHSN